MYLKFIMANEWGYFESIDRHYDLYADMIQEANRYHLADEYADFVPPGAVQIVRTGNQARIVLADTPLKRLHETWQAFHWAVFQHVFWVWAYFVVLVLSFLQLARFRGRHLGAFILFVLTLGALGENLVTCLVEIGLERYAYPTQFIYYLSIALLPLLWMGGRNAIITIRLENAE